MILLILYNYPSITKFAHVSVMILIIVISLSVLYSNMLLKILFNMGNK